MRLAEIEPHGGGPMFINPEHVVRLAYVKLFPAEEGRPEHGTEIYLSDGRSVTAMGAPGVVARQIAGESTQRSGRSPQREESNG